MPDIRVLIVDDHAILRDGIRSLLDRQDGIRVVGEASNGREALSRLGELQPDIILMDVAMPVMDGLEATRRIKETYPHGRVLILTQHGGQEYVTPLLQAGASGYVLKRAGSYEVVTAIRQVYEQGAFLEPGVARQVLHDYSQAGSDKVAGESHLTERERQVLELVIEGKSNKEIARALVISPKTVSVHRSNIMSKLGVHNSIELVRYVMEHNLLDFDASY
ncbi:MAG: response regulator transcription factor [Anaerolineales bacterium]|nr:MAG: response regulator transcription factor [Anaerolineales bacterium]